jgi:diguanylate cyclase (GGDEF)-like protein
MDSPLDSPSELKRRNELARSELQAAQLVEATDPEKALGHLQRAEQMDAQNPAILLLIGRTQIRLSQFVDAVNTLERMLQLQPNHQEALSTLAYGQVELGNFDIAKERAEQALALDPADKGAREVLADCYAAQDNHKACLQELNLLTVRLKDHDLARVTQKAAACLYNLGYYKEALTATSTLLENGYQNDGINLIYFNAQEAVRAELAAKYPNLNWWQKITNRLADSFILRVHLDGTRNMESLQVDYDVAQMELKRSAGAIEEHERRADELARKANTDQLTGLPNRHCFNDQWLSKIQGSDLCGIIAFDLDFFKFINSVHEHAGGDKALAKAAEIGARIFRHPEGNLFRFGGEEFVAIVFDSRARILELAEQFRATLEAAAAKELGAEGMALLWPDGDDKAGWPDNGAPLVPRKLTASVGVAFWPQDGETVAEVLKAADKAGYAAKNRGRNQVVIFEPGMKGEDETKALAADAAKKAAPVKKAATKKKAAEKKADPADEPILTINSALEGPKPTNE